ncbi:MAG TPA: AraC family transcriptional regulator [Steroidobacteraceae bacterium]|nr:AraC family transcriptional regulator [Steroidobacteraceae bacterium]
MGVLLLRALPEPGNGAENLAASRIWAAGQACVIWGRARRSDFPRYPDALSIRATWGGRQYCQVGSRCVAVDDDNYLILNPGVRCSTRIDASQPVEALTICFHPDIGRDGGDAFSENLQPHDGVVSPVLRFIRAHLARGLTDEAWFEEQLDFLLERMRLGRRKLLDHADRLGPMRAATRREARRRIGLATDYLHTYYERDIRLATLARIACLSKFHFLRLFTRIHGVTPHTYLQRKRVEVAVRLLESARLGVSEVAASVGFFSDSTLLRHVRRQTRLSPRQLRNRAAELATPA